MRASDRARLNDSIETALKVADGVVEVSPRRTGRASDRPTRYFQSERFACPKCGHSFAELEPRQFSFNSPFGTCPHCHGLGTRREANAGAGPRRSAISILEGVVLPWGEPSGYLRKVVLPTLAKAFKFDLNAPWGVHCPKRPGTRCSTALRGGSSSSSRGAAAGRVRERMGGRAQERRAPLPRNRQRRGAHRGSRSSWWSSRASLRRARLKPESLVGAGDGQEHRRRRGSSVERASNISRASRSRRGRRGRQSIPTSPAPSSRKWRTGFASCAMSGSST